ncbi:MAG: class I SAM-dependent methyltransferase [Candidatus Woesearchaeota archaeon]|jgi:hypothetical protein|nr:class I SAM-dependent methyltransferase [Candidatus Woesearchaeota archaeon]MDP7505945.1 class I SAM-dependent methyltransferase [Candidatus Woesearchaeota archaeon]MDP7610229.1 class I SAM-dependent methyltransferase [Candidatus Woesearchaeota archaeon]|tara:strand:- start:16561 stop:17091 length:531 start_codon:yes stop_codon:yes gene_type:complete
MPDRFSLIVDKYREFTDSLLNKGVLPLRETSNGFWGISVCEEVFELFRKIRLQCYRSFIDVGSGDGRVTAIASLFTNAVGIESDKELYEMSVKIKEELGLNCEFVNKDFYEYDVSRFEVVYCFPDNLSYRFEKKMVEELKGKLVMSGANSGLSGLKEDKRMVILGNRFLVYSKGKD